MADLRLYALGIDEVRDLYGAESGEMQQGDSEELREILVRAFPCAEAPASTGGLRRLTRLLQRTPAAHDPNPTDPSESDIDAFLTGDSIAPDRVPSAWRILETLVAGRAWGATRLGLTPHDLDDVDFALARGGVSAAVGLRHLFSSATEISLVPVRGLTVGYYDHQRALAMAAAFRDALGEVPAQHQEAIAALVTWLDGFPHWAEVAPATGRPVPDLIGFWVY